MPRKLAVSLAFSLLVSCGGGGSDSSATAPGIGAATPAPGGAEQPVPVRGALSLGAKADFSDNEIRHFLARTHFGIQAGQTEQIQLQGLSLYIDQMMDFPALDTQSYEAAARQLLINEGDPAGLQGRFPAIQNIVASYVPNATYASSRFGQSMESIAQLIQGGGLGTDMYYTGLGGFDTHSGQGSAGGRHPNLMTELNSGIEAFASDMKAIGKWQDCVVVVFSEFGRRNYENGSGGTDHGEGQTMIVTGGAINGGTYGSDLVSSDIRDESNLPMDVDFRQVFSEVIANHLGKDAGPVFLDPDQITGAALGLV